jgi:hypothetical protein
MCPDNKKKEYRERLNDVFGFDHLYENKVKKYERKI